MLQIDRLIWRAIDAVILVAVIGMVCLIALQVGSRWMGDSISWTEEVSRFLFIWTVWLGLAASFRAGVHPAINLVPEGTSGVVGLVFRLVPALATVILFSAVSWYGYGLLRQQIRFGEQSAILQIGMWWSTLPLVLGSVLSIIGVLVAAVRGPEVTEGIGTAIPEEGGSVR